MGTRFPGKNVKSKVTLAQVRKCPFPAFVSHRKTCKPIFIEPFNERGKKIIKKKFLDKNPTRLSQKANDTSFTSKYALQRNAVLNP